MIRFFLVRLVCVAGTIGTTYPHMVEENKLLEVSSRGLTQNACTLPKRESCDFQNLVFRYGYNQTSKKCVLFETTDCTDGYSNVYYTRQKCLETCDKDSVCLQNNYSYDGWYGSYIRYDAKKDDCVEFFTTLAENHIWPGGNVFRNKSDCMKACMPNTRL
uniref:Putative tick kunitz 10 n=1 Tax=Amblyomma americanum TaxID=6943 RepID=A0A0C9S4M6_AMBAM